jgi:hypothetical protein
VFMTGAWQALPGGRQAVMEVLPTTFNWPWFLVALLLIASPALHHVPALFHTGLRDSQRRRIRGDV